MTRGTYLLNKPKAHVFGMTLFVALFSSTGLSSDLPSNGSPDLAFRPSLEVAASDGGTGQYLGNAVAIAGDTAVVANRVTNGLGAVYVFVRSGTTWTQQAKIMSNDEAVSDDFGYSVGISGDYIVVGAPAARPNGDPYRGAAYVFFRSGTSWSQQAKLVASDGAINDGFGASIAISRGDNIVVGAPNHAVGANAHQGAAYFYDRGGTSWFEQEVTRPNGAANDQFGWSVAMSGFDAVVSAPLRDVNGITDQGQAYIYELMGVNFTAVATVTAPDGAANNMFGGTLALSGVSLGSVTLASLSPNASKVYIFQKSGLSFPYQATIFSPGAVGFNNAIALSANSLFIGTSDALIHNIASGTVEQYNRVDTQWSRFPDLYPTNGADFDHFGTAIAASGDDVIVSSPWANIGSHIDQGAAYLFRAVRTQSCDFDGDAKTDISIFRPSGGQWWYQRSATDRSVAFQFGASTDIITPADFTGDGLTDLAFFRPSTGEWFILRSNDFSYYSFRFGSPGDIPTPGDYDGDGIADVAVFRPADLTWYISNSSDQSLSAFRFGAVGDKPVSGDFDGDGKSDVAIFRPNGASGGAEWWIQRSTSGLLALQFGTSTDKAVPGDFTGDGKTDCAFYRPSSGQWFILRSEDFSYFAFSFGTAGDIPVPGDYDGDRKTDAAVFRPSTNIWYVNRTTAGQLIVAFGSSGDVPVPSAYVR